MTKTSDVTNALPDHHTMFLNPAHPAHTNETKLRAFCYFASWLLGMEELMDKADVAGRAESVMQTMLNNYDTGGTLGTPSGVFMDQDGNIKVPPNTLAGRELSRSGRNMLLELQYNENFVYLDVFVGGRLAHKVTVNGWHFNAAAHKVVDARVEEISAAYFAEIKAA